MQVDRKFVPLVCGSQLAIMDQHAADERVQLERLSAQVRDSASLVTVQFQVLSAFSKLLAMSRRAAPLNMLRSILGDGQKCLISGVKRSDSLID